MNKNLDTLSMRVTVSGSFTKHWDDIQAAVRHFTELGAKVLSPINGPPVREEGGFVYLRGDVGPADTVEQRHLCAIQQSDLLYIVNPGGYLGNSVALEIGYALSWHTAIWSSDIFGELPHSLLAKQGTIPQALESLRHQLKDLKIPPEGKLDDLQAYMRRVAKIRGFSEETPPEILILLMEEIGELAKAMRARLKLAMSDSDRSSKNIPLELADCFIYILHLANQTGVNLFSAFREKERLNAGKKWTKA